MSWQLSAIAKDQSNELYAYFWSYLHQRRNSSAQTVARGQSMQQKLLRCIHSHSRCDTITALQGHPRSRLYGSQSHFQP